MKTTEYTPYPSINTISNIIIIIYPCTNKYNPKFPLNQIPIISIKIPNDNKMCNTFDMYTVGNAKVLRGRHGCLTKVTVQKAH